MARRETMRAGRPAQGDALAADAILPLILREDDASWRGAVDRAAGRRGTAADMIDALPAAAAALGADWMTDRLSMVDVTIGAARLEAALRVLEPVAIPRPPSGPTIPVLLPPWEQHAFAAHLAVHRMRRAGVDGVLLPGLRPEVASKLPVVRSAPALLVSCVDRPAWIRLDDYLRRLTGAHAGIRPVFLGGPGFAEPRRLRPVLPGGVRIATDPVLALRGIGLCSDRIGSATFA